MVSKWTLLCLENRQSVIWTGAGGALGGDENTAASQHVLAGFPTACENLATVAGTQCHMCHKTPTNWKGPSVIMCTGNNQD